MTPLNIKTPNSKAPETQEDSVVPDASNYHQRLPQIGEGSDLSYLPNASEVDDNTELPEDGSSFVSAENEDTADLPYYSDPGDSEYHESDISTSTFKYKNNKAEAKGAALPAAEDPEVGEVSTPGDRPVIDDYSNLSDAFDANDGSGSFDARPLVSTPTRQQLSSFSNAIHSIDSSTSSDIKMGSVAETSAVVSAPESAVESSIVGSSTVGSSGDVTVTPSEDVKPNNLFFRQDDGTVLAVRIEPAAGPHLLRAICALSQPSGSPSQLSGLPFAATAARNLDDALANEAQNISSSSISSTRLPSSAGVRSRKASTSVKTSAPVRGTSAATSSASGPTPSTVAPGTVAQMDAVFSLAEGTPYDREWISNHGLNEEVLTEIPNSKHKLDLLVRHGAVVAGDKLCVTYHSSGSPVVVEGEVLSSTTSTNLCVRITPTRTLTSVQGPRDLISVMNFEYAAKYDEPVQEGWKEVRLVSSSGRDFGTLHEVRQAYQVWGDQKKAWQERKSQATA